MSSVWGQICLALQQLASKIRLWDPADACYGFCVCTDVSSFLQCRDPSVVADEVLTVLSIPTPSPYANPDYSQKHHKEKCESLKGQWHQIPQFQYLLASPWAVRMHWPQQQVWYAGPEGSISIPKSVSAIFIYWLKSKSVTSGNKLV